VPGRNTARWARDRGHLSWGQVSNSHSDEFAITTAVNKSSIRNTSMLFQYFLITGWVIEAQAKLAAYSKT
jgi:hypothetical protein